MVIEKDRMPENISFFFSDSESDTSASPDQYFPTNISSISAVSRYYGSDSGPKEKHKSQKSVLGISPLSPQNINV